MSNRKSSKGFTLIELLVVIAIIALLLAILTPALTSVKDRSRRVVCSAHQHSIGYVLNIYATEYDSKYPVAGPDDSVGWFSNVPVAVAELIREEYQMDSLFCPANSLKSKDDVELAEFYLMNVKNSSGNPAASFEEADHGHVVSDFNWLLTFNIDWRVNEPKLPNPPDKFKYKAGEIAGRNFFVSKSTVRTPGIYPLVTDGVFTADGDENTRKEDKDYTSLRDGKFLSNHLDGIAATGGNILYCDGSVRWVKLSEMYNHFSFPDNFLYW